MIMMKLNYKTNYWVYILICENESYYTGYTNDLARRYRSHINATGACKYTRSFRPLMLAQCWQINGDKSFAMQIERSIKMLSREQKKKIIMRPSTLSTDPRVICIPKRVRLQLIHHKS